MTKMEMRYNNLYRHQKKQVLDFFNVREIFYKTALWNMNGQFVVQKILFPFLLDETKQENKCCHSKKKWSTYGLSKKEYTMVVAIDCVKIAFCLFVTADELMSKKQMKVLNIPSYSK